MEAWEPAPPCIHCSTIPCGKEVPLFEYNKHTGL